MRRVLALEVGLSVFSLGSIQSKQKVSVGIRLTWRASNGHVMSAGRRGISLSSRGQAVSRNPAT